MQITVSLDLDFELLRRQKTALLNLLAEHDGTEDVELFGIVNILDEIMDQAVDQNALSEEAVFGFRKEPG